MSIRDYKYIGADEGFMYKLFYNPFANWVVEFIPMWVAPNVLTLIGFSFVFSIFLSLYLTYGI